jgi:hypothetical protein
MDILSFFLNEAGGDVERAVDHFYASDSNMQEKGMLQAKKEAKEQARLTGGGVAKYDISGGVAASDAHEPASYVSLFGTASTLSPPSLPPPPSPCTIATYRVVFTEGSLGLILKRTTVTANGSDGSNTVPPSVRIIVTAVGGQAKKGGVAIGDVLISYSGEDKEGGSGQGGNGAIERMVDHEGGVKAVVGKLMALRRPIVMAFERTEQEAGKEAEEEEEQALPIKKAPEAQETDNQRKVGKMTKLLREQGMQPMDALVCTNLLVRKDIDNERTWAALSLDTLANCGIKQKYYLPVLKGLGATEAQVLRAKREHPLPGATSTDVDERETRKREREQRKLEREQRKAEREGRSMGPAQGLEKHDDGDVEDVEGWCQHEVERALELPSGTFRATAGAWVSLDDESLKVEAIDFLGEEQAGPFVDELIARKLARTLHRQDEQVRQEASPAAPNDIKKGYLKKKVPGALFGSSFTTHYFVLKTHSLHCYKVSQPCTFCCAVHSCSFPPTERRMPVWRRGIGPCVM